MNWLQVLVLTCALANGVFGSPTLSRKKRVAENTNANSQRHVLEKERMEKAEDEYLAKTKNNHEMKRTLHEDPKNFVVFIEKDGNITNKGGSDEWPENLVPLKDNQESNNGKTHLGNDPIHKDDEKVKNHSEGINKHQKPHSKRRSHHSSKKSPTRNEDGSKWKFNDSHDYVVDTAEALRPSIFPQDFLIPNNKMKKHNSFEISNVVVKFGLGNTGDADFMEDPFIGMNSFPYIMDGPLSFDKNFVLNHFCPIHSKRTYDFSDKVVAGSEDIPRCTCNSSPDNHKAIPNVDLNQKQVMPKPEHHEELKVPKEVNVHKDNISLEK